jgi:hypothetical protein
MGRKAISMRIFVTMRWMIPVEQPLVRGGFKFKPHHLK